ncbi:MAG: aminopeptidase [Myxococcota bacterium]
MRAAFASGVLLLTSGCFTTRYLAQAAGGQYELLHKARSISSVREDPSTSPRVKALLSKVPAIKRWGQLHGLTPTRNYEDWVALNRSAAVYVVQGCAPLAFEPRRWSFPIVGSVPYLGFFDAAEARAYAKRLGDEEHLDVTVRTAGAYSTLGWFRDAVLSTMLPDGPEAFGELANVILHESVHATVYVPGQSAFDESLASFVADELTWDLVVGRGGLGDPDVKAWLASEARSARFLAELRRAHDELDALYRSPLSDDEKLRRKRERLDALQQTLGLRRRYNNADLAGVRTYDTGHEAFARLKRQCGTWPRFLEAIRTLQPSDFQKPQQSPFEEVLDALAARACQTSK